MMSALSVLCWVLPLPVLFIVHEVEEWLYMSRWMQQHGPDLQRRFPKYSRLVAHLMCIDRRAFAVAALEELLLLSACVCYVLVQAPGNLYVWAAVFLAFAAHLLVHIIQAMVVRGYVPGVATSVLLLPYMAMGVWSYALVLTIGQLFLCLLVGLVVVGVNLMLAHALGIRCTRKS